MSGLEDLLSQIPTSDIANKIGVDEGEVNKAVQLLVPVLVGGLQENAQDPEHASKIESAADSHAALLDGGVNVDHVDENEGQQAIARIFGGNDAAQVASALAGGGGGNSDLLKQLLPILAPIVLANLVRPLLLDLAGALSDPPRHLIASGLLHGEVDEVVATFRGRLGLSERRRLHSGEWAAVWLSA